MLLVGGLLFGVVVASFMIYYQKTVVGRFVRRLLEQKIHTPEEGILLSSKDAAIKHEICSRSSALRKLVSYEEDGVVYDYRTELAARVAAQKKDESREGEENSPKKAKGKLSFLGKDAALSVRRPDFTKARFFIPEDLAYRAELRFGKRGMSAGSLALTVAACVILFFTALRFIPVFVSMLDVTIGNIIGGI